MVEYNIFRTKGKVYNLKSLEIAVALELRTKRKKRCCICMRSVSCIHLSVVAHEIEVDAINGTGNSLKGALVDVCY